MLPYAKRFALISRSPRDVAYLNEALIKGVVTPEYVASVLEEHDDSWWGARGTFEGATDNRPEPKIRQACVEGRAIAKIALGNLIIKPHDVVVGWLGNLGVVEAENLANSWGGQTYSGPVIAAELHHARLASDPEEYNGRLAYAAVSLPSGIVERPFRTVFVAS